MSNKELWLRKKNTINFSVQSAFGEQVADDIGNFSFLIPPACFQTNQSSQYGIFTLKEFYFISQDETDRVGDYQEPEPAGGAVFEADISGFYVEIGGLGLAPQVSTITNARLRVATNQFAIFNTGGIGDVSAARNGYFTRISGGQYNGASVACSNPMGTNVNVKVYSMDDTSLIANNARLDAVMTFEIEMLDM